MAGLKLLKDALEKAPVIQRGKYAYFVNPLQGVAPPLKPSLLQEVAAEIKKTAALDVDYIVTVEVMGIHISALVSYETGIPLVIIRKKKFGLEGEVEVPIERSYRRIAGEKEEVLYINSIKKGDRILLIDDVMSDGGTVVSIVKGMRKIGAVVKDIVIVMNRGRGPERVKEETGLAVKTLANVSMEGGKVRILSIK